jgi:crotonobetainyl-CoA:carnitine CoA-transferase CaiB-like acyl-CoA transferase
VIGRLSRTPGAVRQAGPQLGQHNREILVDRLGFPDDELLAAGLPL